MQFAVGYQQCRPGEESFVDIVRDYRDHLGEVYFPWVGAASGRACLGTRRGSVDWTAQRTLERDLQAFRDMGLKLDLLFNSNCYGGRAVSEQLQNEVGSTLDYLHELLGGVDIVTTTSLAVARTVKQYFPKVDVRASVNMRIETIEAMQFVSDLFDSYYLRRDLQRDLHYVQQVKQWCDQHGKRLCLLANSGCLRCCPAQTFHDNMVAHDSEIDERKNIKGWTPHLCWNVYKHRANWPAILQASWLRPEDVQHYADSASVIKLATRMHTKPRLVIHAYTHGQFPGNLLDLFEPGFGPAFAPYVIDNRRFPPDWFTRTSTCDRRCTTCSYCTTVLNQTLVEQQA